MTGRPGHRAKSEVIALRLPLQVHAQAVATAHAQGLSVGRWIGLVVAEHLDPSRVHDPVLPEEGCAHPGSEMVILPQGMRRCGRCAAVRGRDGVWRRRDPEHAGVWLSEAEGAQGGDVR